MITRIFVATIAFGLLLGIGGSARAGAYTRVQGYALMSTLAPGTLVTGRVHDRGRITEHFREGPLHDYQVSRSVDLETRVVWDATLDVPPPGPETVFGRIPILEGSLLLDFGNGNSISADVVPHWDNSVYEAFGFYSHIRFIRGTGIYEGATQVYTSAWNMSQLVKPGLYRGVFQLELEIR